MYSIIFTAAIFIGILINDSLEKRNKRMTRHFILGIIATSLVTILWYLGYEIVGWIMVVLPILILLISYITLVTGSSIKKHMSSPVVSKPLSTASKAAPVESCQSTNPPGPYTSVAPPEPSKLSLPASIGPPPTPAGTPMSTGTVTSNLNITPIVAGC